MQVYGIDLSMEKFDVNFVDQNGNEKNKTVNNGVKAISKFLKIFHRGVSYVLRTPSVYYLKMDENHGFYVNAGLSLAKRNFPLSVSTLVNKTIHTEIPVGEDFLWNVSLVYTFNNKYMKQ